MGKTAFCSIVSAKDLPRVKILSDSIRKHTKNGNVHILLCEHPEAVARISNATEEVFLSPREMLDDWLDMAFYYPLTEYKTALTPYLIEYLFLKGYESVVYLDPNIELYGSMAGFEKLLSGHDLVLPSTITESYCEDTWTPVVERTNRSGSYNPGFIGITKSNNSERFITWWKTVFRECCFADADQQGFFDYFWGGMAPSFVENCYVMKNPEYNMAYMNLDHPSVRGVDCQPLVNDSHEYSFARYSNGNDIPLIDRKKFSLLNASERREIADPFSSPEEIEKIVIVNHQESGKRIFLLLYHLKSIAVRLAANIDVTVRWARDQGIVTTSNHVIRVMLRAVRHKFS